MLSIFLCFCRKLAFRDTKRTGSFGFFNLVILGRFGGHLEPNWQIKKIGNFWLKWPQKGHSIKKNPNSKNKFFVFQNTSFLPKLKKCRQNVNELHCLQANFQTAKSWDLPFILQNFAKSVGSYLGITGIFSNSIKSSWIPIILIKKYQK